MDDKLKWIIQVGPMFLAHPRGEWTYKRNEAYGWHYKKRAMEVADDWEGYIEHKVAIPPGLLPPAPVALRRTADKPAFSVYVRRRVECVDLPEARVWVIEAGGEYMESMDGNAIWLNGTKNIDMARAWARLDDAIAAARSLTGVPDGDVNVVHKDTEWKHSIRLAKPTAKPYMVSVIDKSGNTIGTVDSEQYKATGAIVIGSGLFKRIFVYRAGSRPGLYTFVEVEHKEVQDPVAERAILTMSHEEAIEGDAKDEADAASIPTFVLPVGQRVRIQLHESDGEFIVSFDHNNDKKLTVWAHLPGNVIGDEGYIYIEDFAHSPDEVMRAKDDMDSPSLVKFYEQEATKITFLRLLRLVSFGRPQEAVAAVRELTRRGVSVDFKLPDGRPFDPHATYDFKGPVPVRLDTQGITGEALSRTPPRMKPKWIIAVGPVYMNTNSTTWDDSMWTMDRAAAYARDSRETTINVAKSIVASLPKELDHWGVVVSTTTEQMPYVVREGSDATAEERATAAERIQSKAFPTDVICHVCSQRESLAKNESVQVRHAPPACHPVGESEGWGKPR